MVPEVSPDLTGDATFCCLLDQESTLWRPGVDEGRDEAIMPSLRRRGAILRVTEVGSLLRLTLIVVEVFQQPVSA